MGIEILITVLIVAVIAWVAFWLIDSTGIPYPINMIGKAVVAVLALVYVLRSAGLA